MNKVIVKKSSKRGANFVEYLVLLALIAVAGMAAFQAFGSKVNEATKKQTTEVGKLAQ